MEHLDTFLTVLYVMVDDLCKQHSLSMPRHPGQAPKLGLSELLTLALFGQWARFSSEQAFYRFAQRLVHNQGFVNVGLDHDIAEFAVESIRRWWQRS